MRFTLPYGASLLFLSTYSSAEAVDCIDCKRDKSSFSQFCYIDETKRIKTMSVAIFTKLNGESLSLLQIYEEAKIKLQSLNGEGVNTLTLSSLASYINWIHSKEC
jgi:hypothetical protein